MMFEYSQMLNTLIRPLLKEDSDLGHHLSRSSSRIYVIADCCILSMTLQMFKLQNEHLPYSPKFS